MLTIIQKPYLPMRVTSPFGQRSVNVQGATTTHKGIDIGRDTSKYPGAYSNDACGPVYAVLPGVITRSGFISQRGYTVIINHGIINGRKVTTLYQHLHKSGLPAVGRRVDAGTIIGQMGRSGMGSDMAVHLHFELYIDGNTVNPMLYFKEGYVTKKTKIKINNAVKEVEAVNINGNNYIRVQDLRSPGIVITNEGSMPVIKTK